MGRKKVSLLLLLMCCLAVFFWSCVTTGAAPQDLYFQAENCYKALRNQPEKMKYRSYWLDCINKFEAAFRHSPTGPWAPAALYMTGVLYEGLYCQSYVPADREKARSIFEQIIRDYPKSAYKARSVEAIRNFGSVDTIKSVKVEKAGTGDARKTNAEAEACYAKLSADSKRKKLRSAWETCIEKSEKAYRLDPSGPLAAASLYMTGTLYEELYAHSFNAADRKKALELYQQVVDYYPESEYSHKARARLGPPPSEESASIDAIIAAAADLQEVDDPESDSGTKPAFATVTGIRFWSNPEYTRVVIDADRDTAFENNLLKKDPSINLNHQRLYVDLANSRLGDIEKMIPIQDSLLELARAGQYTPDTVRVVVDINSFESYHIFSLQNPFRIVIDVRGKSKQKDLPSVATAPDKRPGTASIARQLALGVGRIVIDPGHGGKDYGAPGVIKGVHEKHVNLEIAKRLAEKIRRELNCEVILTRDTDRYLTLEERTAIANTERADLFISIHANASRNHLASGIETYFLNLTTDEESIAVAARENATSKKNISELQSILNDLLQNAKINESSRLATYVQSAMIANVTKSYDRVIDKGVKQAPFYVLIGAQMPSILVETAFISNKMECARLIDPKYQEAICKGIVEGIRHYIKEIQPAAFLGPMATEGPGG